MNARNNAKATVLLMLYAFLIWIAFGLTLVRKVFGLEMALRVHAFAAPAFAARAEQTQQE